MRRWSDSCNFELKSIRRGRYWECSFFDNWVTALWCSFGQPIVVYLTSRGEIWTCPWCDLLQRQASLWRLARMRWMRAQTSFLYVYLNSTVRIIWNIYAPIEGLVQVEEMKRFLWLPCVRSWYFTEEKIQSVNAIGEDCVLILEVLQATIPRGVARIIVGVVGAAVLTYALRALFSTALFVLVRSWSQWIPLPLFGNKCPRASLKSKSVIDSSTIPWHLFPNRGSSWYRIFLFSNYDSFLIAMVVYIRFQE